MSNHKQAYLYLGDDDYPMGVAARELVDRLVPPPQQAFGLEIIEGRADSEEDILLTIKRCREALVTPGFMMTSGKVIWWRSVSFTSDAVLSAIESVKEAMKELASVIDGGHAGDATLVVTARGMDKRSAFYKLAASRFEIREFMLPEKAFQLEQHGRSAITTLLREKGITADAAVIEMIQERVGADSRQIHSEVEKLSLYVGERKRATAQDVQAVVSTSLTSVMWDLQDAVGERRLADALEILRQLLANRENAIRIVSSLSGRIRDLMLYREALDNGWLRLRGSGQNDPAEWGGFPDAVGEVLTLVLKRDPRSVHPFVAGKMARQTRSYDMASLKRNQRLLVDTHEELVSSPVPESTLLELLLIRLMA